tara:strand:+ start:17015 stop:17659 length:645 start_codon:yes stop_codon:yes gene_type:complete
MGDTKFWNEYYDQSPDDIRGPSSFATWVASKLLPTSTGGTLVEVGCGNGRDAEFFSKHWDVIAVDNSTAAIAGNLERVTTKVKYMVADALDFYKTNADKVSTVYLRFVLHALTSKVQSSVLQRSAAVLKKGGFICIETRSINDPLCGDGVAVEGETNAWISSTRSHYRRFQALGALVSDIESHGFEVVHAYEEPTESWHKDDHAVVLRVIAFVV